MVFTLIVINIISNQFYKFSINFIQRNKSAFGQFIGL